MPIVFRERGFTFFFYSNEGTPREPVHIHVERGDKEAKFWMRLSISTAYNDGYDARTLRTLLELLPWRRDLIERTWMISSVRAMAVRFDEDSFWVDLSDGRVLGVPLAWFPRLLDATPEQRHNVRISPRGLHWEAIDEDISVAGLLAGFGDQTYGRNLGSAREPETRAL